MKVSYEWLKSYIDLTGVQAQEAAELLTRGGIEVDGIEARNQGLSGVVVGHVLHKDRHPDADKLNVCQVEVGAAEPLQIVCGAANVAAGQLVPVATVGAVLPGGLKIKRAKLRGVESQGMICSAKELGINDKLLPKEQQEGILVLPAGLMLGTPIEDVLGLADEVLELDLTPNRADCLSMLGVAYEMGALTGRAVKLPDTRVHDAALKASDHISVRVDAKDGCPHYAARYIKGIQVAPSPLWLQNRLIAAGIRPINNVVDVTNYVMLEYGQPLHAFDADQVADGGIIVRWAEAGETLVTLDDQERKLEPHMLVIADREKAIALAGVMGGANTEVTQATVNVLLESAWFDGGTVRKTSRQLGLRSEASTRFEKEIDPARVLPALDRAAALLAEIASGLVAEGVAASASREAAPAVIRVTLEKINRYLGTSLSALEVKAIFARLQFECVEEQVQEHTFAVTVPTRRAEISRDVDLIEEVARLYGYDHIPTTPIEGPVTPGALSQAQAIRRALRNRLTQIGLQEVISYSFISEPQARLFPALAGEGTVPVRLSLPMSEERSVLRTALLPQLLDVAAYNLNRSTPDVGIFEIGSVFHSDEPTLTRQPLERQRIAGLLTGNRRAAQWNAAAEPYTFYHAKGAVEAMLELLGLTAKVHYEAAAPEGWHPGRTAAVHLKEGGEGEGELLGYVGQLHPQLQHEMDLNDTYLFELELAPLYTAGAAPIVYQALPKYPAIGRDLAVVVKRDLPTAELTAAVQRAAGDLLESVRVFDVYTGEKLGADKKSVALALVYRHPERTLTDDEVTAAQANVVAELTQSFEAQLRQ